MIHDPSGEKATSSTCPSWPRMTPLSPCDAELPPCSKTALELVNEIRAQKKLGEAEAKRFETLTFAENRAGST